MKMGKKDRVKKSTLRGKRKFAGNQFTITKTVNTDVIEDVVVSAPEPENTPTAALANDNVENVVESDVAEEEVILSTPKKTVSQNKIQDIMTDTPKQSDLTITGYRVMDVEILSSIISELYCPICKEEKLQLHEKLYIVIVDMKENFGLRNSVMKSSTISIREWYTL